MKTPIRWAGSKKALLPMLRGYFQSRRYIEPFCGSACFYFDVEPKEAVLCDINPELIRTYRAVRRDASRVIECLMRFRATEDEYYSVRSISPDSLGDIELAARFLFLNRLCFNGIYRTNSAGGFNVPFGRPKGNVRFDVEGIRQAGSVLQGAVLLDGDFEEALSEAVRGDFVYLDPPYAISARRVFAEYHPNSFQEQDLDRLDRALSDLDSRGVHFVLSYADS